MNLRVETFQMPCTDKEQAVKVLEEAAEAFGAWQRAQDKSAELVMNIYGISMRDCYLHDLADELADVIQASCNLAARYGLDMTDAMARCHLRNKERGRYEG